MPRENRFSRASKPSDAWLMAGRVSLVACVLFFFDLPATRAATTSNAESSIGMNLAGVSYYSSEQPFLNIFKATNGWITHGATWDTGEEAYLNLDANGWPITLSAVNDPNPQQFTSVGMMVQMNMPNTPNGFYPGGQYVVLYQGQGTITYSFDAVKNTALSTPGRDVINVTPSGGGIFLQITRTDPNRTGNYIRNIQVVQASEESALNSGQVFNARFLNLMKNFRVLRFMGWLHTNGSQLASWSSRPLTTKAFWGGASGVPIEVAIQLANAVSADAWLNVPAMADDNYITQFATLVHGMLGPTQKVYVEYSNETWNYTFSQAAWIQAQGQAEWPRANASPFDLNRNWFGQRTAQMCDILKSVWGADAGRVICVLGAQAANTYTATESLNCPLWAGEAPCASHGIGAIAIAPYFGGNVATDWTALPNGGGLSNVFTEINSGGLISGDGGGYLAQASAWEAAYAPVASSYHVPLIAYEGGQSFISFPNGLNANGTNNALTDLYFAINRDSRMGAAYTKYLQQWKANGGELFVLLGDIEAYSQYGEWGALESIMQTTSPLSAAPPKWEAIQNFITDNACWWSGCAGTVANAPKAPSNVRVTP